ncbi:hypothetical protein [Nocardia otitidiscaviarum]|uniref:hypothetical protein n=1 Tax=Nocardia otitidiscaviarum TaxID=1823 RepID=UPI0024559C36|nr:hypothetical protein [Nocardia otitidiscaviarum]
MNATSSVTGHLSHIGAGMAYLNSNSHRTGMKRALTAAGVYNLPSTNRSRTDALAAALRAYPEWAYELHDLRLKEAVIAAAKAWTRP